MNLNYCGCIVVFPRTRIHFGKQAIIDFHDLHVSTTNFINMVGSYYGVLKDREDADE